VPSLNKIMILNYNKQSSYYSG